MKVYDLIGIGFGPSNIALAITMEEYFLNRNIDYLFLEKQSNFSWHPNMLLAGSDMQISFLKDLATPRNPSSKYTFLNYLASKNRLQDFVNLKTFYPSRYEFNDYLSWCASHFENKCNYNHEVTGITPVMEEDNPNVVKFLKIHSADNLGNHYEHFTRSVTIAAGGYGYIPEEFKDFKGNSRVFHSSTYLESIKKLDKNGNLDKIAIIGAGQSASEIFMDLHNHTDSKIDLITRSWALKPSDDSPFVNEIFNPEYTGYVYHTTKTRRTEILQEYKSTNYAATDIDLIQQIYNVFYEQKVINDHRHRLLRRFETKSATSSSNKIILQMKDLDQGSMIEGSYDAVILATGYKRDLHQKLLEPVKEYLLDFCVNRDYSLEVSDKFKPLILLQGCCESTHGLSDTLLSNLSIRSQEICQCLDAKLNI